MSSRSNNQGRAFEYACIIELKNKISNYRPVVIVERSVEAPKRAWETQTKEQQEKYLKAADAFINTLFEAEPLILECNDSTDIVELSVNKDSDSEVGVELYMNNGWSLSFRIHNASTVVEPSLKFDIQFMGIPSNIITINCKWK